MVFQECATPTSKPRPNKRVQTRHHAKYLGLVQMMVQAKKDKGKPTRQEYPNGKRTKETEKKRLHYMKGKQERGKRGWRVHGGHSPTLYVEA